MFITDGLVSGKDEVGQIDRGVIRVREDYPLGRV